MGPCCENLKLLLKAECTPQLVERRHLAAVNQAAVDHESFANATQAEHDEVLHIVDRISIKTLICLQYGRIWFII